MCNDKKQFVVFKGLEPSPEALGDSYSVEATGRVVVRLKITLTDCKKKECKLNDVLYVPQLSYNLLSVSKVTQSGKKGNFTENRCCITDVYQKLIATATKKAVFFDVNCRESENVCVTENVNVHKETKEQTWHRRYGHLGVKNLKKLHNECLVNGFDFDVSKDRLL